MSKTIRKIMSSKVEKVLKEYPETRSDNKLLYVTFLKVHFGKVSEEAILKAPTQASIQRVAAYIQNVKEDYEPDEVTKAKRKRLNQKSKVSWREWFFKNIMSKIS